MMKIDYNITVGNLITMGTVISSMAASITVFLWKYSKKDDKIRDDVRKHGDEIKLIKGSLKGILRLQQRAMIIALTNGAGGVDADNLMKILQMDDSEAVV